MASSTTHNFISFLNHPIRARQESSTKTEISALLIAWEKELYRFLVESRKLKKINHIDTALAGFAFREVGV